MDIIQLFLDFALLGSSWVLWLLVALSVLSIGVMIDRFLWFRARDADTQALIKELRGAFERNELDKFARNHEKSEAIPTRVLVSGVEQRDRGPAAVAEAMQSERARWRKEAENNLLVLGTLGNNVPFIGLFGTVLGIIKAFDDLKHNTTESQGAVMESIAEALVATAIGLLVAIPAVIAFNYFQRRLKVLLAGADECAHGVMSLVQGQHHKSGGA